jgi:hypothetical protein
MNYHTDVSAWIRKLSTSTLRDALRILGYAVFADFYLVYRLAKRAYQLVCPTTFVVPPYPLNDIDLLIEGFCHSGNSFLRSNVAPVYHGRVSGHIHRSWALRTALDAGIPVAVLIRSPHDVAASMYYRGQVNGNPISYWAGLGCWYLYYRYAWKYRQQITILQFDQLIDEYDAIVTVLETMADVQFIRPPHKNEMNAFIGPRPPLHQSAVSRWLNSLTQALYQDFINLAQEQARTAGIKKSVDHTLEPARKMRSKIRSRR